RFGRRRVFGGGEGKNAGATDKQAHGGEPVWKSPAPHAMGETSGGGSPAPTGRDRRGKLSRIPELFQKRLLLRFRGGSVRGAAAGLFLGREGAVARSAGHAGGEGAFAVGADAVAELVDLEPQPLRGAALGPVVGGTVVVDSPRAAQPVVLGELVDAGGVVNAVGDAAVFLGHGEARHIARAVGDVDHVLEGDA